MVADAGAPADGDAPKVADAGAPEVADGGAPRVASPQAGAATAELVRRMASAAFFGRDFWTTSSILRWASSSAWMLANSGLWAETLPATALPAPPPCMLPLPPPPPPPSEATSPALGLPAPAPSVPTTEPRSLSPWLPMSESNWIRFRLALPWPPAALWAPLARALRKADFRASIASAVMPSWRAWMSLWNFLMKEMVRALRCSNIFFTWRVASSNSLDSLLPSSSLVFRVCSNFSPVAMALSNHSLISFVTSARSSILKLE
mmetsp:Transcript_142365/g.361491  ORF Transcript_142365/g.361491 Transcript_142365/m.361491 type:complete len:262 (+) Transcript_142365:1596-2381(+)